MEQKELMLFVNQDNAKDIIEQIKNCGEDTLLECLAGTGHCMEVQPWTWKDSVRLVGCIGGIGAIFGLSYYGIQKLTEHILEKLSEKKNSDEQKTESE